MPDGDTYLLIWLMLQALAGKCNSDGAVFITEDMPYTPETLSYELGVDEDMVSRALDEFQRLSLVDITEEGYIVVSDWETEQNAEALRDMREYNREAKRRSRLNNPSNKCQNDVNDMSMTSQKNVNDKNLTSQKNVNGMSMTKKTIYKDKEKEKEREREEEKKKREREEICDRVRDAFALNAPFFKVPEYFSDKLKRACADAYTLYGYDTLSKCFAYAQASSFLKGDNERKWVATFDWIIDKDNIAKILNGNYETADDTADDSGGIYSSFDPDEFIAAAMARGFD